MADAATSGIPTVAPDAGAAPFQRINAPSEAFDSAIAEGTQAVGAGMAKAGQFFSEVQVDDQSNDLFERWNKKLRGDANVMVPGPDGTMQPDTGYMGLRGRNALDARQQFEAGLDEDLKAARKNLVTPQQQAKFDDQTRRYRQHVLGQAGSHADREATVYSTNVNRASTNIALTHIANNSDNIDEVKHGLSDLINAKIKEAQLIGGGPELMQAAKEAAVRDGTKTWLEAISAKNPQRALDELEKNKAAVGPLYDNLHREFLARAEHKVGEQAGEKAVLSTQSPPTTVIPVFKQAAENNGISPTYLMRTWQIESGGRLDPGKSPTGAEGPFQFVSSTAKQYGLANPKNFAESADAAARLAADNKAMMTGTMGRPPTDAELYLAHQQGASGAAALLKNPTMTAQDALMTMGRYRNDPAGAARAIRVNGGDPNAPASSFTSMWAARFNSAGGSLEFRKVAADQWVMSDKSLNYNEQTVALNVINRNFMVERLEGTAKGEQIERQLIDASVGRAPLPPRESIEADTAIPDSTKNTLLKQYDAAAGDVAAYQRNFAKFSDLNGTPFNPYDPEERKAVDTIYQALGGTPTALQAVVDRTGILPKSVGIEIQGALSSNDPNRVEKSLTLASNLLAKSPNIFTKVEGKDKIENDAVAFRHYVEDLGMTAQQATQKIVRDQSPEYQAQVKAKIKAEDIDAKIKKELQVSDIANSFDQIPWVPFTDPKVGFDPSQRSAMFGQYAELVKDRYLETGDWGVSKKQAAEQLKKTWGVSSINGASTVMQYPPEKAPAYANVTGASEMIAKQATDAILGATGAVVERKGLRLQPIPGVTAGAYKAGNPVPYQLIWTDKDGIVQMLNPGKAFVADPAAMREAQTEQHRVKLEKAQLKFAEEFMRPLSDGP